MNSGGLPFNKPEDYQYFGALLNEEDDDQQLSADDKKRLTILRLLGYVKNGTPIKRETALRQFSNNALEFGAGPLFNCILPLLMLSTLKNHERLILVNVIDRLLHKLSESVSPFAHKILAVVEPMLIDEDENVRVEGTRVIYNLSKAVGLNTMIAALCPDIDNTDVNVRNTTAIAFGVVALALGIGNLLPLLKTVCQSKKSLESCYTFDRIVDQIIMLKEKGQILLSLTDVDDLLAIMNETVRSLTALKRLQLLHPMVLRSSLTRAL